ncbi:hypothetical protein [Aquibium oceanicum]|uniref:Uncharacterized protein n=1 Tax=Aquibium oceanicum TaxID=1670800 RepID=A0A1L3SPE5_9HYPH|nr:hypothetical protein [Aquibium oceanicum]APH71276.1 hypothetical protein BSQ44_07720 [Aquibium oceanicum]
MRRDDILRAWRERVITGNEALEMTGYGSLEELGVEAERRLERGRGTSRRQAGAGFERQTHRSANR